MEGVVAARASDRLSAQTVKTARGNDRKPLMLPDGNGLYLRIAPGGSKSWIWRYAANGRRHDVGLGPYPEISLAEAREKAREHRKRRRDGQDPLSFKRSERIAKAIANAKAMTFKQCAEAYISAHQAGWKNAKHAQQWPSTLQAYVYPVFGDLPVQEIDTALVSKVLEPIWQVKTETASRVRGRAEAILDWATTRGYRTGDNPARWKGHLENLLPKKTKVARVEHHAALPYADLPAFMTELRRQDGVGARALEFAILTAARTSEVIGAKWSEIDLEGRQWIIPAERMKAGREHRVPLSEPAAAILTAMREIRMDDYVFPSAKSERPISNMAMIMTLRRMGRGDFTVHGFRSTFSDWCAERTSFPSEVREMALAHTVSDKVEAAYRRGDLFAKRRALMDAWARYCAEPQRSGEIVAIGKARRTG
jgi:integrase